MYCLHCPTAAGTHSAHWLSRSRIRAVEQCAKYAAHTLPHTDNTGGAHSVHTLSESSLMTLVKRVRETARKSPQESGSERDWRSLHLSRSVNLALVFLDAVYLFFLYLCDASMNIFFASDAHAPLACRSLHQVGFPHGCCCSCSCCFC